jgi:hypothetical protein
MQGQTSKAKMRTLVQTREQMIASMVATAGMTNDQIWQTFETMQPEIVKEDDPRRISGLIAVPFDAEARAKLGRAIRSVRGLLQKDDADQQELIEMLGDSETRPASEVSYQNIKRFDTGDPVMNYLHGHTDYRFIIPMSLLQKSGDKLKDKYEYGDPIPAKLLKHFNPQTGEYEENANFKHDNKEICFGDTTGYVEHGIAISWLDVIGGAKGVGKSRFHCEFTKSLCMKYPDRHVLYNYGESNMQQLRQWLGAKVPPNLILGERKNAAQLIADIYKYQPILVVEDSLQTLIETHSTRGMREVVATLKSMANEKAAGCPHVSLISQLNKKNDLKGPSDIGHLADSVYKVYRHGMANDGIFVVESEKNRGAQAPRSARYKHQAVGVVCLGTGTTSQPFNLVQKSVDKKSAIEKGI